MKLKYFLRGLGLGIIFGALVMLAAYMTSGKYKMSDEEVIERAEKLGMVMREDPISGGDDNDGKTTPEDKATDSDADKNNTDEASTDNTTDLTSGSTEDAGTETSTETTDTTDTTDTTETTTDTTETTEDITSEDITITPDNEYITAQITVTSGMSSTKVARLLQDAGIIEDYLDFDSYLNRNGYSTKIRINTYEFNSNMTYEEIAKELTDENYGQ